MRSPSLPSRPGRRPAGRWAAALLCAVLATGATGGVALAVEDGDASDPDSAAALCPPARAGETCTEGNGRQTAGGGEKVSHAGWPKVTGILWKVEDSRDSKKTGGARNDELLGHHGSDRVDGRGGDDILWGDWDPKNNTTKQVDVQDGGPGDDFIYSSHGRNVLRGGPGKDLLYAYYGRGTIDCGPGKDLLRVRLVNKYTYKNCETIRNFCAFGHKPGGGCYKPGEKPKGVRLKRWTTTHAGSR